MLSNLLRLGLLGLVATGLSVLHLSSDAAAQEKVRWKMQSAFGSSLTHLGTSGVRFSKDIERMSGRQVRNQVLRAWRIDTAARVLRCRLQRID